MSQKRQPQLSPVAYIRLRYTRTWGDNFSARARPVHSFTHSTLAAAETTPIPKSQPKEDIPAGGRAQAHLHTEEQPAHHTSPQQRRHLHCVEGYPINGLQRLNRFLTTNYLIKVCELCRLLPNYVLHTEGSRRGRGLFWYLWRRQNIDN